MNALTVGSVFSGIGLLDYGLHIAGLQHAWFCERDEWRRSILAQRWPGTRILDDVRHVGHGLPRVDVIAGGFPCKGASTAGKREGFGHPETVLWREMARAVGELRPRYVLVENVANLLAINDGAVWGEVLGDLAALGYDTVWDCLPAGAVGAPHLRDRVLAVATYTVGLGPERAGGTRNGRPGSTDGRPSIADSGSDDRWTDEAWGDHARSYSAASGWPEGPGQHGAGDQDAPHANGDGVRQQSEPEPGSGGAPVAGRAGEAAADAQGERRPAGYEPCSDLEHDGLQPPYLGEGAGRGVRVAWGDYEPAIRRWEAVHGPAPEPLVRRVDDRSTARVERSRLSALGDGVQVQVGQIAGEYLMTLERDRMAA